MNFIRHYYFVGNDAPPWTIALTRGLVGAFISGGLGFLAVWQGSDEPKVLIAAGLTPFLTYLGIRFGIEGFIDVRKDSQQ